MKSVNKNLFLCIFSMYTALSFASAGDSFVLSSFSDMRYIPVKSHSSQQNQQHQEYCNSMGGVDITDQSKVMITKDTQDVIVCKINDLKKYAILTDFSHSLFDISNSSWRAFAPSGSVNAGAYYATGAGQYRGVNSNASLEVGVPANGCAGTWSDYISGDADRSITVICQDFRHGVTNNSVATACAYGSCSSDHGSIHIN